MSKIILKNKLNHTRRHAPALILSMNVVAAISGAAAINLLCTPPQYAFANESDVHIEQTNSTVKIGNNALSRAFSIEKGKLKTVKIVNNLAHTELIPGESSEEFVIHKLVPFKRNEPPKALTVAGTPKNWSIEGTSVQTNDGTGYKALLDGNNNTYWHSRYSDSGNGTKNQLPILLTIDRGKNDANVPFKSIGYAGRPGKESSNGNIKEFDVYVSNAKTSLFDSKNKVSTHVVNYTDAYKNGICKPIYFSLPKEQKGQFVGFKIRATHGGPFASGSLVNLYKEAFSSVPKPNNQTLAASSVDLEGAPIVSDTSATINGLRKTGKMITFKFKPVAFGNGKLSIVQKVVMYNGDSIMRKFLELSSTDKTVRFSYIDNEHFNVQHAKHTWTIPTNKGGIVEMDMEKAILGQPVYTDGLFMGSEFPEADTQIQDNVSHIRYWSGKNFEDFKRDNQLTDDNKFVTWQSVIGATHSDGSNMNVIQSDFFSYIRSIAKPSEFRLQYNSWFDNMMRISDTNIIKSFKDIDKNFSNTGVRPLDSYVVDDGWNNYRQYTNQYQGSMDVERNGQGTNKSGFWEFNSKFPSKLAPSSALVHKLHSNFGVWIGPRGGYNYYDTLADIIAASGKGSKAGNSIDVADRRYVDNFQKMAKQWMKDYKVNYWKWDGFVDRAQYNAFPSGDGIVGYDVNHQHMYGGPNGYYHVTDMWEKWIHLFDNVWKTASQEKIHKLWISLTCYVNPSPWFLQWSNSIWMQCSHDRNEVSNGLLTDKMNTMLTYRDGAYWEFIKNHNFQFPLSNLYNHDPIYGKEGTGIRADSMTGEQFRNYLYMMGTRGTAFWELYYSDALMNEEKYLVNADYLKWAEKNYRMLRNAKIIGGTPASNVKLDGVRGNLQQEAYGFANFSDDGTEGILSMRNPSTTVKTITFKLGQTIGAKANIAYNKVIDHIYGSKYEAPSLAQHFTAGQDVSVTLQPGETQIWHLYQKQPHHTTTIAYSELQTPRTLRVQMSNHAYDMSFKVYKNGKEITTKSTKSYADLKTFDITLPESASENDVYKIAVVSGKDAAGNQINGDFESTYYEQGVLANVATLNSAHFADVQHSVNGKRGFGITAHVADIKPSTILLAQGKQWALSYTSDSHLRFDVAGATLTSTQPVVKGSNISLVRENNGLIRLYIDGVLDSSAYTIQSAQSDLSHEEITADTHALLTDVTLYNRAINYTEVPKSAIDGLTSHIEAIKDTIDEKSWNENKIDDLLTKAKQAKSADAKERAYKALYAAIAKLIPGEGRTINVARKSTLSCGFVDNDQDASNSGSPLTNAINGMKETPVPYAIFGSDEAKKPAYMTLDLGTTTKLTSVDLWRYWEDGRTYGSTALVVANKADFSDKKVLYYSSANKKIDIFSLGQLPTADLYKETSKGKRLYAATRDMARSVISSEKETIGANVTARYIRLYANGRYLNNQDQGGDNHVVEIEVNGKQQKMPYDISKLKTLIARAGQLIAKGTYTDQTSDMLAQERDKAQQFVTTIEQQLADHVSFNEPLGSIDTYVSSINTAINALAIRTQQSDEHTQDSDQETSVSTNTNDDSIDEASCAITAMYRLYNPWTHEHLFTIDKTEYDRLVAAGWTDEGEIDSVASKNGKAVTRLYNPWTHEHHYASKPEEIAACVTVGWVNEGVKFYSIQNGTIPVYSMYNPYEKKFYHHYTSDEKEIARMERDGWIREDIKWYAAPKK